MHFYLKHCLHSELTKQLKISSRPCREEGAGIVPGEEGSLSALHAASPTVMSLCSLQPCLRAALGQDCWLPVHTLFAVHPYVGRQRTSHELRVTGSQSGNKRPAYK